MNELALIRALHVLGVVLWIGGVAFVTTVLLPAVRELKSPTEQVEFFATVERRFAWQARLTTLLVGISGFAIILRWNLWARFADGQFWWMHGMVAIWLLFTAMLFVAEPLFLHRWFLSRAHRDPVGTFRRIEIMHRLLLTASLVVLAGAVAGSHGGLG